MRRWLLLLLVGCGDDPPGFELRDGSRLHLRYWHYEDGTRQWDPTTFFDNELQADCTLARWSDGHTYCTPVSAVVAYTDDGCSRPVGQVVAGAEPPVVFHRVYLSQSSERLPSRMYARGKERAPLANVWFYDGRDCIGPVPDPGARYFEVEATDAVRVRESEPRGDGRFRAEILTTDDGMQAPSTLHDSLVEADCVPERRLDGSTTCRSLEAVEAMYFRDAACSEHVVAVRDDKPVATVANIVDDDGCATSFHVGPEILSYPLYQRLGDECLEVALTDHDRVFEIGEPLVAPLRQEPAAMGTRLQTVELVDGALHVPAPTLFDTVLGAPCERVTISGGEIALCIPHAIPAVPKSYYRDPTCDSYFSGMRVLQRACEPPAMYAMHAPNKQLRVLELEPPSTAPYYEISNGACEPVEDTDIRALGAQADLGTFVAAVRE